MVSERLHESLVVLKLLMNLTLDEILYLQPARSGGSFSNGPPKERHCVYITPSFLTPGMEHFLKHNERWKQQLEGDDLLYLAAIKSLDRTIDALGRTRVQKTLAQFHRLQEYAQQQCSGQNDVVGMCSVGGYPTRKPHVLFGVEDVITCAWTTLPFHSICCKKKSSLLKRLDWLLVSCYFIFHLRYYLTN